MKGISKYGQFIVKNNTVDENSVPDQSNVSANKAMCGTKLVIRNGKLHGPLVSSIYILHSNTIYVT